MTLIEVFKYNVKKIRIEKNMTQEQLAEKSNLSANYIGEIERENRKVSIDTIEKIAAGLEVNPSELLKKK